MGDVHEKLSEPFEYHLDLLGIRLDKVCSREGYADIVNASCNLLIGLLPLLENHCINGKMTA